MKKRTKKLLLSEIRSSKPANPKKQKFFASFFQKRSSYLGWGEDMYLAAGLVSSRFVLFLKKRTEKLLRLGAAPALATGRINLSKPTD